MDISGIAAAATEMTQAGTAGAIQLAVLKKAMDIQAQSAMPLIQAASQIVTGKPTYLGNGIDTFA